MGGKVSRPEKVACPRCGCSNALPPNPRTPVPCMNCGLQVYPGLSVEAMLEKGRIWRY